MKKKSDFRAGHDKDMDLYRLSNGETSEEMESFYRNMTDNIPAIIWMTQKDGSCIYLNRLWYDFTGQKPEQALGFGWLDAIHPDDRKNALNTFLEVNKKEGFVSIEYRLKDKKGEYKWHQDSGQPVFKHGEFDGYIGIVIDIHSRKQAEETLRQSEAWYKTYAEAMPQMAFIADPEGNIIYYNQRWFNYTAGMEGTTGWGWMDKPIHHPDDLERTIEKWTHSLKTGEPYEIEYRLRRYDGQYRWHLGRAMPVTNHEGKTELWIGTNTDIHQQKTTENSLEEAIANLESKNQKLRKARKLRQSLLNIIAHDLRGPIGNMFLTLDILDSVKEQKDREMILANLRKMVIQQEKIIEGLSEIVQVETFEKARYMKINLQKITDEIINEFQNTLEKLDARIICDFNDLPVIVHVESFVFSILKNLISNAIKYRSEDRPPKIEIKSKRQDNYALIEIKDNGSGIDLKRYSKNLFQPFQRFSSKEEGTGIGLYIVKNLIEGNDGKIKVKSQPGTGTTFFCYFKEFE